MMSGSSRKGGKRFQVLSDDRDAETMIETASTTGSVASLGFVSQTFNFFHLYLGQFAHFQNGWKDNIRSERGLLLIENITVGFISHTDRDSV